MDSITLMPYVRKDGIPTFRDSEIKKIYTRAFDEGWGFEMFHDGSIRNADHFVQYITSDKVMFWGVFKDTELIGFFWLNRIEKTHAYLHFGFFKAYWGQYEDILVAGKKALTMLLVQDYDGKPMFDLILGMYPSWNIHVLSYVKKFGARTLGEIPNLVWSETQGKSIPGTIVAVTREMLK